MKGHEIDVVIERIRFLRIVHKQDSIKGYTHIPVAIGTLLGEYDKANRKIEALEVILLRAETLADISTMLELDSEYEVEMVKDCIKAYREEFK